MTTLTKDDELHITGLARKAGLVHNGSRYWSGHVTELSALATLCRADLEAKSADHTALCIKRVAEVTRERTKYRNEYATTHAALQIVKAERDTLQAKVEADTLDRAADRAERYDLEREIVALKLEVQRLKESLLAEQADCHATGVCVRSGLGSEPSIPYAWQNPALDPSFDK